MSERQASAYASNQRQNMDQLVQDFLPLVKKMAQYWSARLPPAIELDDLMQVGLLALIQASETYDASQGASFSTYASIRLKGAMLDEVRRHDWVPRSIQQKMKQVSEAIRLSESQLGRSASDREIAAALGTSLEEYHKIARELNACRMTSLEGNEIDVAHDDPDPSASLERAGFNDALADAVKLLPEKEQLVMSLYYADELNLREIGAVLEVSESRVSQIHGQALARLRAYLPDWSS